MIRRKFVRTEPQELGGHHETKMDQRPYHKFLKVQGWTSKYPSVNKLLLHLMRKSRSEATRRLYLWHLFKFCEFTRKKPSELVTLRRNIAERLAQNYADSLMKDSPRYSNLAIATLKCFFKSNGYVGARALQLETYYVSRRFRRSHEYIPTKSEIYRMADSAGSLRDRALILTNYSTGFRNSTLRAILYSDIAHELNLDIANVMVPVYPEMKKIDPNACKGGIPYYSFTSEEASQAIRLYIRERAEKYGPIEDNEPLFISEYNHIDKNKRKRKILTARQLKHSQIRSKESWHRTLEGSSPTLSSESI
jgi:site-specific recombinase XerD